MSRTTRIPSFQTTHPLRRRRVSHPFAWRPAGLRIIVHDQRGLTVVEILVASALMAIVTGAIGILMGASVQSKVISASRSANTETARVALEWMADRLRNAGLNVLPSQQAQLRCKDRVVAQDAALQPTSSSVYVSGDMLNTVTSPPYPVATIGYYLAADPGTGNNVVMEYNQSCSSGATAISTYSTRLSNPKIKVTSLTFQYFDANGAAVTNLTNASAIRSIQIVSISMTVQGSEGRSGLQQQVFQRYVQFWDPDPTANTWLNLNENY